MFLKKLILSFLLLSFITNGSFSAEKQEKLLTQNWSFNGFFGKFDRASLQRGYQVYTEVCASCHSMNLLSYRNLSEVGGPSFSEEEVKAIASKVEVLDDKVRILEERVANAEDDEVFILSKIIGIRQLGVDNKCWGVVGACDYIIGLHSAMTYVKAKEMYEKGNP